MDEAISTPELRKFLVKAKKATYASGTDAEELGESSKKFVFQEGDFRYQDIYFGSDSFIGEEIVWKDETPVWGMNYFGRTVSDKVSSDEVYRFLRKAMRKVSEEQPFRGPKEFEQGDFRYTTTVEGEVNSFHGVEEIFYKYNKVYVLRYHGGMIGD